MTPPPCRRTCRESSRRGSEPEQCSEPRFLTLGDITRPHGISGEVRVHALFRGLPRLDGIAVVYLSPGTQPYKLQSSRFHRGGLLLKLAGCDDRTAAERLRGQQVAIRMDDAVPLGPDEYYVYDLLDLAVVTEDGELLGELVEVIFTGANDVYRVVSEKGEILLPAIRDVIRAVDMESGEMRVSLLPGLR